MLPNLARGSSSLSTSSQPPSSFTQQPPVPTATVPEVYSPSQPEPAITDDNGSSTPVMDEPEEKASSPPPKQADVPVSKSSDSKTKTTPIDFLSQLLTKTNNSSSSSNFLQTLSLLTNTVKTQYNKTRTESDNSEGNGRVEENEATSPTSAAPSSDMTSPPVSASGNWSGWKPVPPSQPPLPSQDPSSPPVIGQAKAEPPPPLPQHPPRPPEPLPPQPFGPPSQPDFSLPPPLSVGQPVSQAFIPPPVPSSAAPFPPRPETSFSHNTAPASAAAPSTRPNLGFNQTYQFPAGGGPPPPRPDVPPVRPPLPAGQAPIINIPPPNFMPRPGNTWEQPTSPVLAPGVPPPTPPNPPFSKPFVPPPPPPDNSWQPPPQQQAAPPPPQNEGYNQISSVPSQRTGWGSDNQDYNRENSWESGGDNQSSGYAHPWDQPGNYDEEEEDNEYMEPEPVNPLPPAPKKSILRNSRTSSLREVTLVDETNSGVINQGSANQPIIQEAKPSGILKKPPMDHGPVNPVNEGQSEFINILKQKSGSNLPSVPPATRMLTTITPTDSVDTSVESGERNTFNTIGVLSHRNDDMDIEGEEHEDSNEHVENSNWDNNTQHWSEQEESGQHWDNRNREFPRRTSDSDRNYNPNWQEHTQSRPWRPRGPYGQDNFRPRSFPPRPRFGDNFHGPSPAKRPFYPPRPRMPYYRY